MITTTKKQYDEFKRHVDRLVVLFGLHGLYDITVRHWPPTANDAWSECEDDSLTRTAWISLSRKVKSKGPMPDLKRLAAHEVAHLFTADMSALAKKRYTTEDEIIAIDERMANVLERILTA